MTDNKTIGITSLITLLIVTAGAIGPSFFEEDKFYCEAESSILNCPGGLSGGQQTRCYLNTEKNSWDYCRSGWIEVTDDRPIQEEPKPNLITEPGAKFQCPPNGEPCVQIN